MAVVEAQGLTKRYAARLAVDNLSFAIDEGEAVGFLGPNGAGKTTTLRMLAGYLTPTAGKISVSGYDLAQQPLEAKRRLGYLPEHTPLPDDMRVEEFLRFRGKIKGLSRTALRASVSRVIAECCLADCRGRLIGHLSKGFRQRVGLADCLLAAPPLLLLDEPTAGLDPNQVAETRGLIRRISAERAILFSSHILPEVEVLCRRVLIIHQGRLLADGDLKTLAAAHAAERLLVIQIFAPREARATFARLPEVKAVEERPCTTSGACEFAIRCSAGADPRRAVAALAVAQGWLVQEMRIEPPRLEDIFARLTRPEAAA